MITEPAGANDIRLNVRDSLHQLRKLQEQGRIVMTQDRYNPDWPDSSVALEAAIQALDRALDAMHWMETLPHMDGGYPSLADEDDV